MRFIPLILLSVFQSLAAMPNDVSRNPLLLLIPIDSEGVESGSGFVYSHSNGMFLVTARHVVFKPGTSNSWVVKGTNLIVSDSTASRAKYPGGTVNLGRLATLGFAIAHETRDVAVVHLFAHTTNGAAPLVTLGPPESEKGKKFVNLPGLLQPMSHAGSVRMLKDVNPGEIAYVLGFPTSVTTKNLNVLDLKRPLIRQALVADVDEARGNIVLDCAVYKGNSGGPVVIQDDNGIPSRIYTIGLVSKFVPFYEEWQNVEFGFKYVTTSNSGYAIVEPLDAAIELMDRIKLPP